MISILDSVALLFWRFDIYDGSTEGFPPFRIYVKNSFCGTNKDPVNWDVLCL